jgi:hypothetical protein
MHLLARTLHSRALFRLASSFLLFTACYTEAFAQLPPPLPTRVPSVTATPTEEPEVCELDGASTLEATIDISDLFEIDEPAPGQNKQLSLAKSAPKAPPATGAKPARPRQTLQVTLVRQCCSPSCTTGTLTMPGFECKTLELPFRGNQREISCIPPGTYTCRRVNSPRFEETFEITGVPNRSHVLIHAGNKPAHTKGCILLGMSVDSSQNSILSSKKAVAGFMKYLSGKDHFVITIQDRAPKRPTARPPIEAGFAMR